MINGTLVIRNLGRNKYNGKIDIEATDESDFNMQLEREFRKHLMSDDISFENGKIIVSGFRVVGEFEFIAVESK